MLTRKVSSSKYRRSLKNRRTKRPSRGLAYYVLFLLLIAAAASGWWLWRAIYVPYPQFNFILISVNDDQQKILSGETLALHPNDRVEIIEVSTNILFNLGVRFAANNLDVSALQYEGMPLSSLLPDQEIYNIYKFNIRIKYYNQDLGNMVWEVQPYTEDWLGKANRTINKKRRIDVLERAQRLLPKDKRIRQKLLNEYKSNKMWKRAAIMLKERVKKEPDQDTLNDLLEVYSAMSDKDGIISVLKSLVKMDPGNINARSQLAEVLEKTGKRKEAIRENEALLKQVNKKDRLPVYKSLGYLYAKEGKSKKAISFYLKALDLDKKDANLYYNLSNLYEKTRQKEKADTYLSLAVNLKGGDAESRLRLAGNLVKKGRVKEAKKHLSEILKQKPKSIQALILMAQVLEKQGKKRDLKKIYKKILSLDPKNETVIYNLGTIEYETGNLDASRRHFEKYVKSHPKDSVVHGILFDIYKKQKNPKKAFKEANILIGLRPKEIDLYIYMFNYLKNKGDYETIIKIMKKGLKANPKQTDFRKYLVVAYLETGKEGLAIKQLEETLKIRPKDIDLLFNLARLREKQGMFSQALKEYERIIKISPDNEEAEEAYLRLRLKGVQVEGAE